MVKVIGIVGSPRLEGNTKFLVEKALKAAEEEGAETELIHLAKYDINPCKSCMTCRKEGRCSIDDDMGKILDKIRESQGIIIGSPVYFGDISAQTKIFMDRTLPLRANGFEMRDKVGGAITVGGSRNGGQETSCMSIHNFFLIHEAIVVGDASPTAHYGGTGVGFAVGDCKDDGVGIETSENLGRRVARVALKLHRGEKW